MVTTLAQQINKVAVKIQREKTAQDILRLISFGSKFAGNTTVINLAARYGASGEKVVIVDLVPQNKSLRATLKVNPQYFVENYLNQDDLKLSNKLVQNSDLSEVSVISTNASNVGLNQLSNLLEKLTQQYDCVVINEYCSNTQKQLPVKLRIANFSVLVVDQQKALKRKLVRFLDGIQFEIDGYVLAD